MKERWRIDRSFGEVSNNKHMISKVKSPTQKLSEVDILKHEMKKLQEENEKLKKSKKQRDEL